MSGLTISTVPMVPVHDGMTIRALPRIARAEGHGTSITFYVRGRVDDIYT